MSTKWFDLSALGASIERDRDANGVLSLKLTFDDPEAISTDVLAGAQAEGWVASDEGPFFRNYQHFRALSEIRDRLGHFFDKEDLYETVTSQDRLSRGEVVIDVDRPAQPGIETIEGDVANLDAPARERILAAVVNARRLSGLASDRRGTLFDGNLYDVLAGLRDRHGTGLAGAIVVEAISEAKRTRERFAPIEARIVDASRGDGTVPEAIMTRARERHAKLEPSREADTRAIEPFRRGHHAADIEVAHILRSDSAPSSAMLDGMWKPSDPKGARTTHVHESALRWDKAVPQQWIDDAAARIGTGLEFAARQLHVDPSEVFGRSGVFFHLVRKVDRRSDGVSGLYRGTAEREDGGNTGAIRLSPNSPGSVMHEIGHAHDFAFPGGKEKYDFLLEETGIGETIREAVSRHGGIRESMKAYLTDPVEMFARTFDAAMVNRALDEGDENLRSLGGSLIATTKFDIGPKRSFEVTQDFLARLREWNDGLRPSPIRDVAAHPRAGLRGRTMDPDTLFELSTDDYSIRMLETIFGGVVPAVITGAGDVTQETMLTQLLGVVNVVCLVIGAFVLIYTLISTAADTATDGVIFGRSSDTKYTLLRVGLGSVLLLPVAGSYSLIQIFAIWLMGMGAGLGDTSWRYVADNTLDTASYVAAPSLASDNDWRIRGEFAEAIRGLSSGHLCRLHLNRLARIYSPTGDPDTAPEIALNTRSSIDAGLRQSRQLFEMFFADADGFYRMSDNACGSVTFPIQYSWLTGSSVIAGDIDYADGEITFTQAVDTISKDSAFDNGRSVLSGTVNDAAVEVATKIFDGERDEAEIAQLITDASEAAATEFISGHSANVTDDANFSSLEESIRELVNRNGWVFAANWQRGLSAGYLKMQDIRDNVEFSVDATTNIDDYFGTGFFSRFYADTTISGAAYQPVIDDFAFLSSFDGLVSNLALPPAGFTLNSQEELEDSDGSIKTGRVLSWLYGKMLNWMDVGDGSAGWSDPMLDYQAQGTSFIYAGAGLLATGATLDTLGNVASVSRHPAGTIGGAVAKSANEYVLGPAGKFLLYAGLAMTVILPLVPMIYFFSAVIGWVLLCIEAMFALPLAVLLWFAPAREQSIVGPWHKVVLTLFGLLMRPAFAIAGLIACLVVMWVGVQLQLAFFRGLFTIMTPEWTAVGVFIFIGLIFVFVLVSFLLVLVASQLITSLGDWAMNWIGIAASGAMNAATAGIGDRAIATANPVGSVRAISGGGALASGSTAIGTYGAGRAAKLIGRQNRPSIGKTGGR